MYLPDSFRPSDAEVAEVLAGMGAGELITSTGAGILATMLPLIWEPGGASAEAGEHGRLMGHLARKNRQWQEPVLGDALVIVRGPDAYISPAWYETKREHGRVVPTWNYVTAHLHGRLVVHDDPAWCERNVRALVERHERGRPEPWSVDDAPPPYVEGQLRAIVGVEVIVSRIEAKAKLSQNRSAADVLGAIDGLEAVGDPQSLATAAAMRRTASEPGPGT
jgi:transcriptional regulator